MFNVGSQELLVVLLLVFILFGPRHIPGVAHALGKGLGDLRRTIEGFESNVRRAGGSLPRFPRDLDDLDAPSLRRGLTSIDQPEGPGSSGGQGAKGAAGAAADPPAAGPPQEDSGGARP